MKTLRDHLFLLNPLYWPVWLALGCLWSITKLPYRWQMRIGCGLGKLFYVFGGKLKQTTKTNIKLCFPHLSAQQQHELVKKNFANLGIGIIEAAMAWWLPDEKLKLLFTVSGIEYVEAAFARGKGILLIGPHFTCLEMIGRLLGTKHSFSVMYAPHKKKLIAFIHEKFRKKPYVNYIPRHRVRELLDALSKNTAIWYAYDIDGGKKHTVFAPFFGIPTASLTAVSRIAKLSDTTIVPIGFYRDEKKFHYEVVLTPPLENFPTEDLVEDATRLNTVLEEAVLKQPEQYIWQYKRFKTRPAGEKRFY